jgi:hypothetical protein
MISQALWLISHEPLWLPGGGVEGERRQASACRKTIHLPRSAAIAAARRICSLILRALRDLDAARE